MKAFDYSKLRGKIVEKYGTLEKFSEMLGITATTAGRKFSGKSGWTQDEIIKSCDLLQIPTSDIASYFFTI